MKKDRASQPLSPPPAIAYVCKKAQVTEATARVIASMTGFSLPDEWRHLAVESAQVSASSAWEAHR
jgi:hypothetical protein